MARLRNLGSCTVVDHETTAEGTIPPIKYTVCAWGNFSPPDAIPVSCNIDLIQGDFACSKPGYNYCARIQHVPAGNLRHLTVNATYRDPADGTQKPFSCGDDINVPKTPWTKLWRRLRNLFFLGR